MATFIAGCLTNLGIETGFTKAGYNYRPGFQHVYDYAMINQPAA